MNETLKSTLEMMRSISKAADIKATCNNALAADAETAPRCWSAALCNMVEGRHLTRKSTRD